MNLVYEAMHEKLAQQEKCQFVGNFVSDTTRVVRPRSTIWNERSNEICFGLVELFQNWWDFMKDALALDEVKRTYADSVDLDQISWTLDEQLIMRLTVTPTSVSLEQLGRPLSLDCIGSGTRSKVGSENDAGGFGDGSKTGIMGLIRNGYACSYHFWGFNDDDPSEEVSWKWSSEHFESFSEPHMSVRVSKGSTPKRSPVPVMHTVVVCEDDDAHRSQLFAALASAMGRFPSLFFDRKPDPDGRTCHSEGFGSWFHASCFEPVVPEFAGQPLGVAECANALVGGILYPCKGKSGLVVEVPGRGLPGDSFPVFTNQFREVCSMLLENVVKRQIVEFAGNQACERAFAASLRPLLRGGNSLMCATNRPMLLTEATYDRDCQPLMRDAVIFMELAPAAWGKKEASQRAETRRKVDIAILACDSLADKARFCQYLRGESEVVIRVSVAKTNSALFPSIAEHVLRELAAEGALQDANGKKKRCVLLDRDMRPAVDYVCGEYPGVKVVRVFGKPESCETFDFRSGDVAVYSMELFNGDKTVETLIPYLGESVEERARAMKFVLHFNNRKITGTPLRSRVKLAVRKCNDALPYDIGTEGKKRQLGKDDHSDSSESDDAFKKALGDGKYTPPANLTKKVKINRPPEERKSTPSLSKRVDAPSSLRSLERRPEPQDEQGPNLAWNTEAGIFSEDGAPFEGPSDLPQTMVAFEAALGIARELADTGRCQIFPAFSPKADWLGLHYSDGECLINLAFAKTQSQILMTIIHEVAHEESAAHDFYHGRAMHRRTEAVLARLLS